jgi:hypothetical protein
MYYSMPINIFFIVKNHWEPYFTDNLRKITDLFQVVVQCVSKSTTKAVKEQTRMMIPLHIIRSSIQYLMTKKGA